MHIDPYQYKNLTIEISDEPNYRFDSNDNNFCYSKHYFADGANKYPTSKHGIKIYRKDQIIDSCIVIGSGGSIGIYENSALLDTDQLLICCSNTIFCLTLPDLELKWRTKADQATCFQIFKYKDDYLIHGELQVSKLDSNGKIKWEFSGADVFVSRDNEEEFRIENDAILLTDFVGTKYMIDFNGKLITSSKVSKG